MVKKLEQLSKTVSHALRYPPWEYELEHDEEGWVNVQDLLAALRIEQQEWRDISISDLIQMID